MKYPLNLINGSTLNSDHIATNVCVDPKCDCFKALRYFNT